MTQPHGGEREEKEKRGFCGAPHFNFLSDEERRDKRENLFYIGGGGFYRGVSEDEECNRVIVSLGS
jgi:hypothetical protein